MTSECFVYITLPGETEFVTAGRFQRTVDRHGVATGRFVYGKSYLARENAVPIDPLELKLGTKTYQTRLLKGIFGALRDASPDHWGRRIIERHFGSPGPDELDYLLHSPDDRAGALGFGRGQEPPAQTFLKVGPLNSILRRQRERRFVASPRLEIGPSTSYSADRRARVFP